MRLTAPPKIETGWKIGPILIDWRKVFQQEFEFFQKLEYRRRRELHESPKNRNFLKETLKGKSDLGVFSTPVILKMPSDAPMARMTEGSQGGWGVGVGGRAAAKVSSRTNDSRGQSCN